MKKNSFNKAFLLFIIFCTPLYLIKIALFKIPFNVLELLMLLFIFYNFFTNSGIVKKISEIPKSITISIFLLLLGVISSILLNNNIKVGLGILKAWFILPILFSLVAYSITNSTEDVKKILLSIYCSIATVGAISIIYKLLNIVTYDNRLASIYASPNYLAMYLAPGFFIGIYFVKESMLKNIFSKQSIFYSLTTLLIFFSIYYTYSYGSWLAIILTFLMFIFVTIQNKKRLLSLSAILLLITLSLFIFQLNSVKFSNLRNNYSRSSFSSRIMIWNSAKMMLEKKPIFGIGSGNFQNKYLELQPHFPPYLEWAVPEPHNIFLAFWLQSGLIGLASFCWLLFYIFKTLFKLLKNKKGVAMATPIFCFFLYIILHGLIDTTYWKNDLSLIFWLYFFLAISINKLSQKEI